MLVTLDVDFANIRNHPPREHEGVIVLRLRHQDKQHVLSVLERLISLLEGQTVRGTLWVVDEERVRIRE